MSAENTGLPAANENHGDLNVTLGARPKKLLFRAWHRGTREADLMVGRYAQANIARWDESMLDIFEEFLDEADADIFDWISGRQELPVLPCRIILSDMKEFYQNRSYE